MIKARRLASMLAALAVMPALIAVTPSAALATDCYGPQRQATSPVSRADFVFDPVCDGGRAGFAFGSVGDTSCDARTAYVYFALYDLVNGQYVSHGQTKTFAAAAGCGSTNTFATSYLRSPGASGWWVRVTLWACSTTCSSMYHVNFNG